MGFLWEFHGIGSKVVNEGSDIFFKGAFGISMFPIRILCEKGAKELLRVSQPSNKLSMRNVQSSLIDVDSTMVSMMMLACFL